MSVSSDVRLTGERPDLVQTIWARVGGGLEEVPGGRRHGPADPDFAPPGGPWEELWANGRLVGWAPQGAAARTATRRAQEEGERILLERRTRLLSRLGHKVRSSVLALQESARQAAFGRRELLEQIHDQAQDVGRRALALEAVAIDRKDAPRAVVIGAVLNLAAAGAQRELPDEAVVRVAERVFLEALERAYEWMGGPGSKVQGELTGSWWRLEFTAAPDRQPLSVPELGEPLVRHLVDTLLEGWLDASRPGRPVIYLPAV
jgi:hypothetical protein